MDVVEKFTINFQRDSEKTVRTIPGAGRVIRLFNAIGCGDKYSRPSRDVRTGTIILVFSIMTTCFATRNKAAEGSDNCRVFSAKSAVVIYLAAGAYDNRIATRRAWTQIIIRFLINILFINQARDDVPMRICSERLSTKPSQTLTGLSLKQTSNRMVPHTVI